MLKGVYKQNSSSQEQMAFLAFLCYYYEEGLSLRADNDSAISGEIVKSLIE